MSSYPALKLHNTVLLASIVNSPGKIATITISCKISVGVDSANSNKMEALPAFTKGTSWGKSLPLGISEQPNINLKTT